MIKYENSTTHILSLSAGRVESADDGGKVFRVGDKTRSWVYTGALPLSLDMIRLDSGNDGLFYTAKKCVGDISSDEIEIFHGKFLDRQKEVNYYTDAIVNIVFKTGLYEWLDEPVEKLKIKSGKKAESKKSRRGKRKVSALELRTELYKDGFLVDFGNGKVAEYVRFKRSSSKARDGAHLFIRKDLKERMDEWRDFGIIYELMDRTDLLAQTKACEGLTSSGIVGTVPIQSHQILLIKDMVTEYEMAANVTKSAGERIVSVEENNYLAKNDIWDGQSLLCESLFAENEEVKGMMLLRNSFFKSCGFNTKIQDWFRDNSEGGEYVYDMFGRRLNRADIKLITTPNSLKILKFFQKFGNDGDSDFERKKLCYEKWLENMRPEFGVVKSEKASSYGDFHRLTYQIINSLPLKKDDIGTVEIVKKGRRNVESEYLFSGLLKDDYETIVKIRSDMDYYRRSLERKEGERTNPTDAVAAALLDFNPKIWRSNIIVDMVNDRMEAYKENLREGRIRVNNSDYAVLFGNPVEMLQYATFGEIRNRPLVGNQIYCKKYEKTGNVDLACFRNPHITMGNVLVSKNTHHAMFKYFNLTDNIVISNAFDTDVMHRLQGHDYDSDELLICTEPIIVKAAKEIYESKKFKVPINRIKSKTKARNYGPEAEADIDHNIAVNLIGRIVNMSQLLNSYYWDYSSQGGQSENLQKWYYDMACVLSSLSQIEIDKAKLDNEIGVNKFFADLKKEEFDGKPMLRFEKMNFTKDEVTDEDMPAYKELAEERDRLKKLKPAKKYKEQIAMIENKISELLTKDKDAMVRPEFFKHCGEGKRYKFEHFNTPMDYVQIMVSKMPTKPPFDMVEIEDIVHPYDKKVLNEDQRHLRNILEIAVSVSMKRRQRKKAGKSVEETNRANREYFEEAVQKLKQMRTLNENTVKAAIHKAYGKGKGNRKNYSGSRRAMLSLLYQSHPEVFLRCFKKPEP